MKTWTLIRSLGPVDLRNVGRDRLLFCTLLLPLVLVPFVRYGVPALTVLLQAQWAFDLAPYYPLVMSFFVMTVPTAVGMIVGFLLLDERDEGVLTALLVTPVPLNGYLVYRSLLPILAGTAMTLLSYPLAGLTPLPIGTLLAVAGLGAFTAPLVALVLASFAENNVAGFALLKLTNAVLLLPAAAFFFESPWQIAAGVVPAYWPMKVLWLAAAGQAYGPALLAGFVVNGLALVLLVRRFRTVVHR